MNVLSDVELEEELELEECLCPWCGAEIEEDDAKCWACDEWISDEEPDVLHGWEYELERYGDVV